MVKFHAKIPLDISKVLSVSDGTGFFSINSMTVSQDKGSPQNGECHHILNTFVNHTFVPGICKYRLYFGCFSREQDESTNWL